MFSSVPSSGFFNEHGQGGCLAEADNWPGLQFIERAEASEHGGVDGVGFGASFDGFGEAPRLQRIDLDDGHSGAAELAFEAVMVGAGWLKDDAADGALPEPCQRGGDTGCGVGNCRALAWG